MKAQFIDKLVSQPWNIDKLRGRTILGQIISRLLKNDRPAEDVCGEPLPKMQIVGDVAIIPVRGVVGMNIPAWVKEYGFNLTDANDIESEILEAQAHPAVSLIVLDVDSPGGLSLAGDKLFDVVKFSQGRMSGKPVFGWCADGCDMASTAYEAVAACTAILAGRFASCVGCVGSYLAWLDDTEFWAQQGIRFKVFRSGDLKGIGEDELSEKQAAYLQSLVDVAGATFRKNVLQFRTGIDPADMQGQWFTGAEAARRGFVSGAAGDLTSAIARFRRMI